MRIIPLQNNVIEIERGARFIALGDEFDGPRMQNLIRDKISRATTEFIPGIWGTLGYYEDDQEFDWRGEIVCSRYGNKNSEGVTLEEVKDIYNLDDGLLKEGTRVIERFINFDNVEIPRLQDTFDMEDLPDLRLTLFLQPDEGALVFYQHYSNKWNKARNSEIEYILSDQTEGHTTNRDRLTYRFKMLPKRRILKGGDKDMKLGKKLDTSFVVKILVFKRNNEGSDSLSIFNRKLSKVLGEREEIYIYNSQSNRFETEEESSVPIQNNVKSLLLFHGTLSSTDNSFNGLLDDSNPDSESWFKEMMNSGRRYAQILALDHPTITKNAKQNRDFLKYRFSAYKFQDEPLDVLTFSRGGLVAKSLINDNDADNLPVRKAAFVACANGVTYFKQVGRLLSIFKIGGLATKNLATLTAQFSVEFVLNRPGIQQMTHDHSLLTEILDGDIADHNANIEMQAFTGQWRSKLASGSGLRKRIRDRGLHWLTYAIIGGPNDWVVGKKEQSILPEPFKNKITDYSSYHTRFFVHDYTAPKIKRDIKDYFSA